MAQHTPRIYFATRSGGDPELVITGANWRQLEKVYGHELQPEVRTQIYDATWMFLAFSDFEQLAQPTSIVRKRIKKIENAASKLENAILEIPEGVRSDAAVYYADHLINQNLSDTRIIGKLKVLGSVMVSVAEACRTALQQLETEKKHGPRKGTAWQRWVLKLGLIAVKHRLPTEARKDTDKTDQLSPFVELVDALQLCLPRECRRARSALAKAIHDARNELSGRKTPRRLSNKSRHLISIAAKSAVS